MQPEAQVLLREFNRRLRAALSHAPNHVRVEAALEVESHVLDVLSRRAGPSSEPESEQVARILSGFGSPEEYARALLSQLPDVPNVRSGVREVALAIVDLFRGMGRLGLALGGQILALAVAGVRCLGRGLRRAAAGLRAAKAELREPLSQARRWGRNGLRTGGIAVARLGRWGARGLRSGIRLGRRAGDLGLVAVRLAARSVRWALRAAALAAVAGLALLAFAVAGFSALAPDVTGWWVHQFNTTVAEILDELRWHTVAHFDAGTQAEFVRMGSTVLVTMLAIGLISVAALALLAWHLRRPRGGVSEH